MSTHDTEIDSPLFERRIPPGDDKERPVCTRCGFVDYSNPKILVGSVATLAGRILMCRRAIGPREGLWTLPAGYLENHELPEEGAIREAHEEAHAKLRIKDLLAIYSIRHISQVQLIFRAELLDDTIEAGPESQEVRLFRWHDIPWEELAFPSVRWALRHHRELGDRPARAPFTNPEGSDGELPGA